MKITVDRFVSDNDSTVSKVSVDGRFVCFGLEDEHRFNKMPKETRIPAGTYQVRLRNTGGMSNDYAHRYGAAHRGMLHIQDVPNFECILIHCGNTQADTEGCLLVGTQATTDRGNMSISQSRRAYQLLYPLVSDAAQKGILEIEFLDNDLH